MEKGEGLFYKAVNNNLTDFHTGKHDYKIGKGSKLKLKKNQSIECGEGYHFMDLWGAIKWGKEQHISFKIISAKIKSKDILAVHWKIRVKAYSDVQEVNVKGLI